MGKLPYEYPYTEGPQNPNGYVLFDNAGCCNPGIPLGSYNGDGYTLPPSAPEQLGSPRPYKPTGKAGDAFAGKGSF